MYAIIGRGRSMVHVRVQEKEKQYCGGGRIGVHRGRVAEH